MADNYVQKIVTLAGLGEEIKSAANAVLKDMRETPGGDAVEYKGSMFAVEWLRDAVEAFEEYMITDGRG